MAGEPAPKRDTEEAKDVAESLVQQMLPTLESVG